MGWYLAKVISIEGDGSIYLKYHKGNLTDMIKSAELKWHPAYGTDKQFQPTLLDLLSMLLQTTQGQRIC